MKLPLKLAILVIVIFGLLVTGMVLWRPGWRMYYETVMTTGTPEERQHATKELLILHPESVFDYCTERYKSKDVKERMKVVDELCACGDKGKAVMKEIFRNWCYSQQVKIPGGTLMLENGSKVEIKSLRVDKYEVTIEKFHIFQMLSDYKLTDKPWSLRFYHDNRSSYFNVEGYGPAAEAELAFPEESNYPVNLVTWHDAKAYADWLGMRLPTECEWIYAARAGSTGIYCFGDNGSLLDEYAWHWRNSSGKSHPVGQKKPNNWGLFDVHGNVAEWCADNDSNDNTYPHRGCYYLITPQTLDFSHRSETSCSYSIIGFRCVRDVK